MRRLAERNGLLPDRIRVKEIFKVSDEILGWGGLGDVRSGTYEDRQVAVKVMRISEKNNFARIKKVSIDVGHPVGTGLNRPTLAILQGGSPLEHAVPSKHLGTRWGSGGHTETAAHHRVTVDGARRHHEVYQ